MTTIRIGKDTSGIWYEIIAQNGTVLARSIEFRSICLVEEALRGLREVCDEPRSISFKSDAAGEFQISNDSSRRKVKFKRVMSEASLRSAFASIKDVKILDTRPPGQRRTNIGGTLKSLI